MKLIRFILTLATAAIYAMAADQTVTLSSPLREVSMPLGVNLTLDGAPAAIAAILGGPHPEHNRSYVIHIVKYQTGRLAVEQQKWYVFNDRYRSNDVRRPNAQRYFTDNRILGHSNIAVVWTHIVNGLPTAEAEKLTAIEEVVKAIKKGVPRIDDADTDDAVRNQLVVSINNLFVLDPTSKLFGTLGLAPANKDLPVTDIQPIIDKLSRQDAEKHFREIRFEHNRLQLIRTGSTDGVKLVADNGTDIAGLGGILVEKAHADLAALQYRVEITRRTPLPQSNLRSIADIAFAQGDQQSRFKVKLRPVMLAAGSTFETSFTTSDIVVSALYEKSGKEIEIGKKSFINEKEYWYDFSLALPLSSHNEIRYDRASDGITARKIDRRNLYALFNFGVPRDPHRMRAQYIPVGIYGMALTGQPLRHHLVGLSIGLNKVNFFGGMRIDRKQFLRNPSQPADADNRFDAWRTHSVFGINFPVGTIVDALKPKAK